MTWPSICVIIFNLSSDSVFIGHVYSCKYIVSMRLEKDLDEYFCSLLDTTTLVHKRFLINVKKCYRLLNQKPITSSNLSKHSKSSSKNLDIGENIDTEKKPKTNESKSKNKKYNNVFSDEGPHCQEVLLKGRHKCNCQASKHALINNCLNCGRVVCNQEESGPCVVCGKLVYLRRFSFFLRYVQMMRSIC